jgi:hypothetical protein
MYEWKNIDNKWYYYVKATGRIVGKVHYFALQTIVNVTVLVNTSDFIFEEKSLGLYVEMDLGRKAVENYWSIESRTLIDYERTIA